MKKAKKVLYLYYRYISNIYIYILYIVAIYTHARGAAPTPLRHAEPFRLVVPSCLLFPPPYIPPRCAASPPSLYPFPRASLFRRGVLRSGCCHSSPLAFRRSSGTPAALCAAVCKIFFQACEVFRLFRAVLPSSFVPAL